MKKACAQHESRAEISRLLFSLDNCCLCIIRNYIQCALCVHLHCRYLICNSGVPTGREQSALFSIRAIVIEITLFMVLSQTRRHAALGEFEF